MPSPSADTHVAAVAIPARCSPVRAVACQSYVTAPSKRRARRVRNVTAFSRKVRARARLPFASNASTRSPSLFGTAAVTGTVASVRGAVMRGGDRVSRCRKAASRTRSPRWCTAVPASIAWYTRKGEGGHSRP